MLTWNLRLVKWDQNEQWLPYLGLWVIAFVVWRVLAARALVERLGEAFIPGLLIVLSCASMWVLLTVFAVALAQRPKVRRTVQKEIADYQANAEARALAAEQAAAKTALTASVSQSTSTYSIGRMSSSGGRGYWPWSDAAPSRGVLAVSPACSLKCAGWVHRGGHAPGPTPPDGSTDAVNDL